jgi:perosamine synthetase
MIQVFKPEIKSSDIDAVVKALKKGEVSGNFSSSILKLENNFAKFIGTKFAVATSSGSTALHAAIAALELKNGSEILVSSTTNIASALAITHNGCIPVPIDSSLENWNIDPEKIEKKINKKTKAILVVHFLGCPVDMYKIIKIAKKYKLKIIEDAAEAHGASINRKKVGSFGDCGCFSFYANKIISSGEGGIITTDDKKYYKKLLLYRNLGFTNPRFVHFIQGFNFRMTGYQAAFANSQLKRVNRIIKKKRKIFNYYYRLLKDVNGLEFQKTNKGYKNVHWMVGIRIKKNFNISKKKLKQKLYENNVETRDFFMSIAQQPCFKNIKNIKKHSTPNSNKLWNEGFYLPSSHNIKTKDIHKICDIIKKYS